MIKNQRQYHQTLRAIQSFELAIQDWDPSDVDEGVSPEMHALQLEGIKSQLETLVSERAEYEALLNGQIDQIPLNSLEELPVGLIKARIARGMTQRQLADAMGIKQQQVQRWEHEDYESVSFGNLLGVAHALNVKISECINLPHAPKPAFSELRDRGIEKNFIKARLVPRAARRYLDGERRVDRELLMAASDRLKRIYGFEVKDDGTLASNDDRFLIASSAGRFKLPANAGSAKVKAYAVYAQHLGSLVLKATAHLPLKPVPSSWQDLQAALCGIETVSFERLVRGSWELGVPVLPLVDPVRFHGYCHAEDGRFVVVLKQSHRQQARWAFDLLHELAHTSEVGAQGVFTRLSVDATSEERRESEEEAEANELAGNVLLGGKAADLFEGAFAAAKAAGGLKELGRIAFEVADSKGVDIGFLANYFAFRLRNDYFEDWWGPATRLQPDGEDPHTLARNIFFEYADLNSLQGDERELLSQALDSDV